MASLAADVRSRRWDLRLRQRDLAELAGTSERFARDLENGRPTVCLDTVAAVLAVLGLELRAQKSPTGQWLSSKL